MPSIPPEALLDIRAGTTALQHLRQHGLHPADIGIVPGAAGGPKAIGIVGLDQAIFPWLATAPRKREFIGASIGAWRLACALQDDPCAALGRLSGRYIDTVYPQADSRAITAETWRMLDAIYGTDGYRQILAHPDHHLSILVAASHGLLNTDQRNRLLLGLAWAATLNGLSRRLIGHAFSRIVCHDPRSLLAFLPADGIPTHCHPLHAEELPGLLMATAAIPVVLEGIRLEGVAQTLLRDGGLTDYHLDLPFANSGDLVLYPHFTSRIIPGWFDKFLPWRQARQEHQRNTILIAPSARYLASLPLGKLPDRQDFKRFAGQDGQRQKIWRQAQAESLRLGDAFSQLIDRGDIAALARPL